MKIDNFFRNNENVESFQSELSSCQNDEELINALFSPIEKQKMFIF